MDTGPKVWVFQHNWCFFGFWFSQHATRATSVFSCIAFPTSVHAGEQSPKTGIPILRTSKTIFLNSILSYLGWSDQVFSRQGKGSKNETREAHFDPVCRKVFARGCSIKLWQNKIDQKIDKLSEHSCMYRCSVFGRDILFCLERTRCHVWKPSKVTLLDDMVVFVRIIF